MSLSPCLETGPAASCEYRPKPDDLIPLPRPTCTFSRKVSSKEEVFELLEACAGRLSTKKKVTALSGLFYCSVVLHTPYIDMPLLAFQAILKRGNH